MQGKLVVRYEMTDDAMQKWAAFEAPPATQSKPLTGRVVESVRDKVEAALGPVLGPYAKIEVSFK